MSRWGNAADDLLNLASMTQKRESTSLLSTAELDPSRIIEVGTGHKRIEFRNTRPRPAA